jgi:hypothetical protein
MQDGVRAAATLERFLRIRNAGPLILFSARSILDEAQHLSAAECGMHNIQCRLADFRADTVAVHDRNFVGLHIIGFPARQ